MSDWMSVIDFENSVHAKQCKYVWVIGKKYPEHVMLCEYYNGLIDKYRFINEDYRILGISHLLVVAPCHKPSIDVEG